MKDERKKIKKKKKTVGDDHEMQSGSKWGGRNV